RSVRPLVREAARAVERLLRAPGTAAKRSLASQPLHWELSFPEVFARARPGFDAFVGNPPWVSFAGRAAQPIAPELYAYFRATSASFAGYRNLQGVFVERCARLLRPGGRLGLIVPSSMSALAGYTPTRCAHERSCETDA